VQDGVSEKLKDWVDEMNQELTQEACMCYNKQNVFLVLSSHYILRESWTTQNVLWSRTPVCVCLSVGLSVCLSVCLSLSQSLCLSVCLSVRSRTPTLLHGPGCNIGA